MEYQELLQAAEALKKSAQELSVSLEELEDELRKFAGVMQQYIDETEKSKNVLVCRRVLRRHPKKSASVMIRLADKRNKVFHCRNGC